jgi:hypothetical protein
VFAFGRFVEFIVLDPPPAVATNVVTCLLNRLRRGRIALERKRAGIDRHRQFTLLEGPVQAPEADAAAIFEHALSGEIAFAARYGRARRFGQGGVADAVVVHHAVF